MSTKKINEFNHIINATADLIKQLVLQNYNNINLLSNTLQFYRILELAKISLESINRLLPVLKMVYKFSFKYDYFLNDLSDQFLIKTGEDIEKKNKNIISKNIFLQELFGCEKYREHQLIIKHGFVFNDNPNNGLVFYNGFLVVTLIFDENKLIKEAIMDPYRLHEGASEPEHLPSNYVEVRRYKNR